MSTPPTRPFLEFDGPDDEPAIQRLLQLAHVDYTDMGKTLATYRAWPGPLFWLATGGFFAFLVAMTVVAALQGDGVAFGIEFTIVGMLLLPGSLLLIYSQERHRVCEHGLVVGFRKRSRYVIPWETLDPGRVRVGTNIGLIGRRPDVPQTSSRYRVGVFALKGLALNGLDTTITTVWTTLEPDRPNTPFGWWILATRKPDALARDIEKAMIADGYDAGGLARRAHDQAVKLAWNPGPVNPIPPRMPFDPVLGTHGPLLPPSAERTALSSDDTGQ